MSRYEARLERDVDEIRSRLAAVAEQARIAVDRSIRGVVALDRAKLYGVVLGDHPINREIRAIDRLCHAFVARHLPAAGHLRFVSSVLRLTIAVERIGDYAVTVGRVAVKFEAPLPESITTEIEAMADKTLRMLERATRSFVDADAELARDTKKLAATIDRVHDTVFAQMIDDAGRSAVELVSVLTILGRLERVSDQAKNICEETLFTVLGEIKPPKQYPVLFVDDTGALHAPLARALAHKAYPNSGAYASAGTSVADAMDEGLLRLGDRLSLELPHAPVALRPLRANPAEYHVIVALNIDPAVLGPVPFHTAVVSWQIDPEPAGQAGLELLARDLGEHIRELMELLRGPDAD